LVPAYPPHHIHDWSAIAKPSVCAN